jgi:CBS domain-containing protein
MKYSAIDGDGAEATPAHLNTRLRNLALAPPIQVSPERSVRDALRTMDARDAEAAVVVDDASGVPLGIVTARDALRAIVSDECDLAGPVAGLMIGGLVSLSADATVHQATLLMFRRGMRHLVLTDLYAFQVVSCRF